MTGKRRARASANTCPLCRAARRKSGLPISVPLAVPTYWTPDEALAIFELVSELRDLIAAIYETRLIDAAREHYQPTHVDEDDDRANDDSCEPF